MGVGCSLISAWGTEIPDASGLLKVVLGVSEFIRLGEVWAQGGVFKTIFICKLVPLLGIEGLVIFSAGLWYAFMGEKLNKVASDSSHTG